SIKPGKAVLPWPSITTRPVAGAAEISVILPPLTTMEAFSICSSPVKTRTFEMIKSFCAYAVTESQESARATISVRCTVLPPGRLGDSTVCLDQLRHTSTFVAGEQEV